MSASGPTRVRPPAGRRPLHLRTKLILATLALLTAICLSIGVFSHLAMSNYLTSQIDNALTLHPRRE